jgi:S-adenosylmethionine:tRNA-ribosyltransferase-isomerase (queuine synthetase)
VTDSFSLDLFDYELPRERIAQHPLPERDEARLLVLDRRGGPDRHSQVRELSRCLRAGDLLVGNASWVRPARLRGRKASGGGAQALILGALRDSPGRYRALLRCTGRLREGQKFRFGAPEGAVKNVTTPPTIPAPPIRNPTVDAVAAENASFPSCTPCGSHRVYSGAKQCA